MKKVLPVCFCLMASAAYGGQVRVDLQKQDCIRLLSSSPDYVAGVSVTGKNIVSSDLNGIGSLFFDFDNMVFPVYLDLERDFPFWKSKTALGKIPLTRVEIKGGKVFVNDVFVSENGVNSLKNECKSVLKKENIDKNSLTHVQ